MPLLRLADRVHDLECRALVMGVLNRTPDSFFDRGSTFDLDAFIRRADELAREGADVLDVGGVKAGPGPDVDEGEELERVVPAIEALRERFDVPLSVDTWRASVLEAACRAGAVVGNEISGFRDPEYLPTALSPLYATAQLPRIVALHDAQCPEMGVLTPSPRRCSSIRTCPRRRELSAGERCGSPGIARR